jgi:hypothetical protein
MTPRDTRYVPSICPECVAGKHRNCNGDAWDEVNDRVTTCDCDERECAS